MPQTLYTYSVANDTLNGSHNGKLKEEIQRSAIVIALDYTIVFGDILDIYMKDALTAGDETILNTVVANHDGLKGPDDPQPVSLKPDPEVISASNELRVSQQVNSGETVADTYIVPDGATATVKLFLSSSPDSSLANSRLVWDYGGGGEEILWVVQREGAMPKENTIEVLGDGVKKIAVVCDNGCASAYYFNAFAKVEVS